MRPRRGQPLRSSPIPQRRPRPVPAPARTEKEDPRETLGPPPKPPQALAKLTLQVAADAEQALFKDHQRPENRISQGIRALGRLVLDDHQFIRESIGALFRWWGWIEPLGLDRLEARLLVATLLDRTKIAPACRVWARAVGVDPRPLTPMGQAPDWATRARLFRRLVENPRASTEPWLLFPRWLKKELITPPGTEAPKYRLVHLLDQLQRPPDHWYRSLGVPPRMEWERIRSTTSLNPLVETRLADAGMLPASTSWRELEPLRQFQLSAQELTSQAIVAIADPDRNERWWIVGVKSGVEATHLADRMEGKGTIIVSTNIRGSNRRLASDLKKCRHSNLELRDWDGKSVVGHANRFHGVLLMPPSTGIGWWRHSPGARWLVREQDLEPMLREQERLLDLSARGVRDGGVLLYGLHTLTHRETLGMVERFLERHADFQLDPFPNPTDGDRTNGTLTLWPDQTKSSALFVARMIKLPSHQRMT